MDCFVCYQSFNLSSRLPLLICCEEHTACTECSASLNNCPICRTKCLTEKKTNFALQDLVQASRNGNLCPQIPSDHILLGAKIAKEVLLSSTHHVILSQYETTSIVASMIFVDVTLYMRQLLFLTESISVFS
ncbi:hypothetical protein GEMRC1_002368 [Eukaryota sp. GEM-RC1]